MLKRKALIRKLPAVEALGSVTVICSDKTGTLTENQMRAATLQVAGVRLDIPSDGPLPEAFQLLLTGAALCNDASMDVGDPTETALVRAAAEFGINKAELEQAHPRIDEIAFTSARKRMSTVHQWNGASRVFTKGAPDVLMELCTAESRVERIGEDLAATGMRVIGVAFRNLETPGEIERDLTFLGVIALIDPPRPEAAEAVARCKTAGIRPIMITGDHPLTAHNIASRLGIAGRDVHARVSPETKLRIVEALQAEGQVVAMTGDGVNDAPALKKSDIGVAMGITGTDVAKEAADMVLLDDNFRTIVDAVEEGRVIYGNVRKFIRYMLTTNSGEIWLMLGAPLLGMPLPLLPLQILWMNLVTDGLPALALGFEPAEADTMQRPPYDPAESVFSRGLGRHVVWVGLLMGMLSLGMGYWFWSQGDPHWQTVVFTSITLSQMAHVMAIRSERQSLFHIGLFSNKPLLAAVALTCLLQLALVYWPPLQGSLPHYAAAVGSCNRGDLVDIDGLCSSRTREVDIK